MEPRARAGGGLREALRRLGHTLPAIVHIQLVRQLRECGVGNVVRHEPRPTAERYAPASTAEISSFLALRTANVIGLP